VINRDEIGFLTTAFNQLHHDFDGLVESLEARVVLRTADLIRVNEQLQASEKRYRDLFDLESDALFIIDCQDGTILEANNAAVILYGYNLIDLLKMHDCDLSADAEAILSAAPARRSDDMGVTIPLRWHRKQTGERFPVEITARMITWKETEVYLLAIRDVTGRWIAEQELERLAVTDPLTGLYNRRHFFARSLPIFEHARHAPCELAALMIDIDHFKNINDRYGHATGDQVLREVAHRLTEGVRTSDILARYGGEEFAVLLPGTSHSMAPLIADRLLKMIGDQAFVTNDMAITVTVSIGLAVLDEDVLDLDQLIVQADQAMYRAKKEGRNRCACWAVHW
jgi:diguanylate cyclase (GGDEF)-like protein/PAS domain S-box-containing protein